ncbi:PKD domain-containing protein [bacterium]|nr:PKD domain-containing protein [bacterium]
MRIVNWALMLLIAAVLIGCSGSQHSRDGLDSVGDRSVQAGKSLRPALGADAGAAVVDRTDSQSISSSIPLDSSKALDPALNGLFAMRDSGLPSLSGMEARLAGSRSASGIGREWQDGADALDKSSNAVVSNTSLSMFTGAGQRNWAIYMLPDVNGDLGFSKLTVETSNVNFTGGSPGFLVGLANYASGRWEILDRSESETYTKTLTAFADYVSPLGNVFLFVLTHDGNGIQLDRVGFDVDRSAPEVGSVSPSSGETGAQIQPVASVSNLVETWEWNFGGGASPNTSSEESPLITLGAEGTYSASVTALSRFGEAVFNFTLEVGPVSGSAPEITAVSPLSGESGSIVSFIPTFSGTVDSWDWQFNGAGNPDSSTLESPDVELGEAGTYNCSVTATNLFGSDQFDFSFEVQPSGEAPVIISVDPLSGATGAEITFTPSYTGTVDTWDWQFGPAATPDTSADENPMETLGAPGIYECSVTASNSFGNDTLNFSFEVTGGGGGPTWTEIDLSSITGTDGGWTPSVAVASNGNPMVAYANLDAAVLDPYVVIGDSTLDLTLPANWTTLEIADLALNYPGASAGYMDIVIPSGTNLPRVSYNVLDITGATVAENSRVGFSALDIYDSVPTWNTYYIGNADAPPISLDGAFYTSIDMRPTDSVLGISTTVGFDNSPLEAANQMYYYAITYDWENQGNISYNLTRFTGGGFLFPHGRYHASGEFQAVVTGGNLLRENGGSWAWGFQDPNTTVLGSLDMISGGNTGMSYCQRSDNDYSLHYTELDPSNTEIVNENILTVTDSGAGENVATISQLDYMADGTPCIVFTEHNGTSTMVRFAISNGAGWDVEDVSSSPNTFTADPFDVWCDLAQFANGNSIVCYSRFDNDVNTLRVAIRSAAP